MNYRERIMAVLRGGSADKIPLVHYDRHFPRGEVERKVRNMGVALCVSRPCFTYSRPNVELIQRFTPEGLLVRTYNTPLGSVTEKLKVGVGYGEARYGRDWKGMQPRRVEFLIKKPEDYDIVKFIVEDTHYEPFYDAIEDANHHLGDDGIVQVYLGYSPLQTIIIEMVGFHNFYVDYLKNRRKVEELYEALDRKYEEKYKIAAEAPADFILYGDNIDGQLVSPKFFERYCLPAYKKCADKIHSKGKILGVHMDGRLNVLKNLIGKANIDVVEAFTPPPLGDLRIDEALDLWESKVIWMNYPSSVCLMGPEAVKKHTLELLKQVVPGDRLLITASTENVVPHDSLLMLTEIISKVKLPFSKEDIEKIK